MHGIDTETEKLIEEILKLAPEAPEIDDAGRAELDKLLAEEISDFDVACLQLGNITDRVTAGAELDLATATTGLKLALEVIETMRTFNNILLDSIAKLHRENQRLSAIVAQADLVAESGAIGNC